MRRLNNEDTLKDYTKIVVETDEENPVTIATITNGEIFVKGGYRVRLTPNYREQQLKRRYLN